MRTSGERAGDLRFAHCYESGHSLASYERVHDIAAHLGSSIEESEEASVVALRYSESYSESVRNGFVNLLIRSQFCESVVELCAKKNTGSVS